MSSSEDKIKKAFSEKTWNEIKTSDSWQIFKIMAEFVEGFEKMGSIGPCVSIFGSARTKEESESIFLLKRLPISLPSMDTLLSPVVALELWKLEIRVQKEGMEKV